MMISTFRKTTTVVLLLTGVAVAEASGPDFYKVTGVDANDTLNIHEEPHVKSKIVAKISHTADCLKNLGCTGGLTLDESMTLSEKEKVHSKRPRWCKIEFDGVQGWAYGRYLAESSCTKP